MHGRSLSALEALGETAIDLDGEEHVAAVDPIAELIGLGGRVAQIEVGAGGEALNKLAAVLRVVAIEHGDGNVLHFKRGRVAEHQHLDDRRNEEHETRARIAQRLDEFLHHHALDAFPGLAEIHSSLL